MDSADLSAMSAALNNNGEYQPHEDLIELIDFGQNSVSDEHFDGRRAERD